MEEVFHIISTNEEIDHLINYLQDKDYVAYDTETNGLSANATIVGLSVAAESNVGYYIITSVWDPESKQLTTLPNRDKVIELLRILNTKKLITHNGLVDWQWTFVNYGVQLKESGFHDTMISGHLLNENVRQGLKERGYMEFGAEAKKEQEDMKASVIARGGLWEEKKGGNKEMFKADPYILGKYGAKDAILTLNLFYVDVPKLFEQNLDKFFYEEECMPLFKGPTYDLNTTGLKVDMQRIKDVQQEMIKEINDLKTSVIFDIAPYVKDKYPGKNKKDTFNIDSGKQLAWLLFVRLENDWDKLTDAGRELARDLIGKVPYSYGDKQRFEHAIKTSVDIKGRPYKLENYIKTDKMTIGAFAKKYKWCENLLRYKKLTKLLGTYIEGIQEKVEYGVINPRFNQIGTTGTRYSSRDPNFQNLPSGDKRVKSCIVARPGKVFIGADYSQLEPRVFASFSQDERLMNCFSSGDDFYSVVGMHVFNKTDCIPLKEGPDNAFGTKYSKLRKVSKEICLAGAYGTTANRLVEIIEVRTGQKLSTRECQEILDDYFNAYPKVKELMLTSHKMAMEKGEVINLFGRPRHIPEAKKISKLGNVEHAELPYEMRTLLNLSVNYRIQGTAGSIINRAMIAIHKEFKEKGIDAKIVSMIHDEIILECDERAANIALEIMRDKMENTVILPGVKLEAVPKIAKNMADLK